MPNPTKIPVSRSDKPEETAQRETQQATAELKSLFKRPITPVPQAELDLLAKVALGDTGQGVQNLMTCPLVCLFVP